MKKIYIIVLSLFMALGSHSTLAMKGNKSFFTQTLPRWTGNTLFVTGALLPTTVLMATELSRKYSRSIDHEFEALPEVSSSVRLWAHDRLRLNGVKNPEKYKLKYTDAKVPTYASEPYRKIVLVKPDETKTSISKLTRSYKADSEWRTEREKEALRKELPIHNFVFDHECGHVRNKDHITSMLATVSIPLLSLCGIKKWNPFRGVSTFGYQALKGPFGVGVGAMNTACYYKVLRLNEFRADDAVHNDRETLDGGCIFFQDLLKNENINKKVFFDLHARSGHSPLFTQILWAIRKIYSTHPSTEKRLARLKKRLAKLQVQEEEALLQKEYESASAELEKEMGEIGGIQGYDFTEEDLNPDAPLDLDELLKELNPAEREEVKKALNEYESD